MVFFIAFFLFPTDKSLILWADLLIKRGDWGFSTYVY